MRSDALLTALVPIDNYDPDFLREALASLLGQTVPSWQALCIVEPARREEFVGVLAPFLQDPRIKLVTNNGRALAGAFNTGMRHATTPFVAILLADDVWSPDAVAVLNAAITDYPDVDFFHSSRRVIDALGTPLGSVHCARQDVTLADFAVSAPLKHLLCWRREMGLAIGGMDERLPPVGPDDFDFPWSMAEHGARIHAVPECLYLYRDHRRTYRLTTHLSRRTHEQALRAIFAKHGLSRSLSRRRIRAARRSYLRQCLYRSELHRWLWEHLGLEPRARHQEVYR